MLEDKLVAAVLATVLLAAPTWGQADRARRGSAPGVAGRSVAMSPEVLSSASVAQRFYEIAWERLNRGNLSAAEADQVIVLLTAARNLDPAAEGIEPMLLEAATQHAGKDYSDQVVLWLRRYVDESADQIVVAKAVRYLLDRLNTREERKKLLEELAAKIGNKNPAIDSELALRLGLIMQEKADVEGAKFYLVQAYTDNKYNKRAFAQLAELAPGEIGPSVYLEHLRLTMREDPLDPDAVLNFAQYAERLQLYGVASDSYHYAAELFDYLYPGQALPPHIYLPWAVSSYNAAGGQQNCMQIAENIRSAGRFDILLEAMAGRAAAKTGDLEEAQRIFRQAEQLAQQLLDAGPQQTSMPGTIAPVRPLTPKQFAWFYCFGDPTPQKALDWANKAYSAEPNVPAPGALLAYALSMNDQLEWAKPLLASFEHNQIADLVQAMIHLSQGSKTEAVGTLRRAIAKDPGSLAAERAREMLGEQGVPYVAPVDPAVLRKYLSESLGRTVVPAFTPPHEMIDVQCTLRGSEFPYGTDIAGTVAIRNRGSEPLVLTDGGLFRGRIRVDARISGDIQREIPEVLSQTIRTALTVPPGHSVVSPLRLSTGPLRQILMTYPQASLEIEFVLYLDPVTTEDGVVSNRLVDLQPAVVAVTRPGVELTAGFVRTRFNSISSGQPGHKVRIAQLFAGLLKEQQAMSKHGGALYPYRYADWLPNLLRSAFLSDAGLLLGPGRDDWVVKASAMVDLLSLPIDQTLATAVAKNLNHPQWPVRLMALYLLSKSADGSFAPVLDWAAQNDTHPLVRSMAMALNAGSPVGTRPAAAAFDPSLLAAP
ncbi:MAG: hypothetical protein JW741_23575 [Sedimentisphaerales bacterium]|nr:hypothetical protein [Sedimentisphaerales bacterium]